MIPWFLPLPPVRWLVLVQLWEELSEISSVPGWPSRLFPIPVV
jgi:hypothetical protein